MATLRTLTGSINASAASNFPTEFLVYNLSIDTPNNGGRCCLWTVPAGTKYAKFEVWGGYLQSLFYIMFISLQGSNCCSVVIYINYSFGILVYQK